MALDMGNQTFNMQKRYSELKVTKDMNSPHAFVELKVETGYYDGGKWFASKRETKRLSGDAVWYLFGLTPAHLNTEGSNLGTTLETAIYGLVAGAIPTECVLTATLIYQEQPVTGFARLRKGDVVVREFATGEPVTVPLLLGATLEVHANGFESQTLDIPVLADEFSHTFEMSAL